MTDFRYRINNGVWTVLEGATLPYNISTVLGVDTVEAQALGASVSVQPQALLNQLLTPAYFGTPEWVSNPSKLRYMPMVLENPIYVGSTTDYQGNVIHAPIANTPSTSRLITMDNELHYYIDRGSYAVPNVALTESIQLTTPGKIRIIGLDLGGLKLTVSRPIDCYMEGIRTDCLASVIEDDAINVAGDGVGALSATLPELQAARTRYTIQNFSAINLHGTNKAHAAKNTLLAPITTNASKEARIQLAQAPTTPVVVGNDVIVGGTFFGGQMRNLNDFNKTWTVKSITTQTDFVCEISVTTNSAYKTSVPASSATDSTVGAVWVMASGTGNHADMFQHVTTANRLSREVRQHNLSGTGNYVGTILQNVLTRATSNFDWQFWHPDSEVWPTDDGSEVIRNGSQNVADGKGTAQYINVFGQPRPVWNIDLQVSPNSQTSPNQGGIATTTTTYGASRNAITYDRSDFRGGIIQGTMPTQFQRTNLLLNSQNPADAGWFVTNATKTSTANADPFGTSTALLVTTLGGNASSHVQYGGNAVSYTTGLTYTLSAFVKPGTQTIVQLAGNASAFGSTQYASFDLSTGVLGTVVGGTATITPARDGYYRITFTLPATATIAAYGGIVGFAPAANSARLPAVSGTTNFLVTGVQVEQRSSATDYISTTTAARTVSTFVDHSAMGFAYILDNNRYTGYTAPLSSHITDLVFEGVTSNIPESILGGTTIGTIRTVHTLNDHPGIIDYSVVGSNVLTNQWFFHGRRLVRGKTAFTYTGTPGNIATVTVRATWRGTNQFFDKTFSFPIVDDVPASGLTLATPTFGTASADGGALSSYLFTPMAVGTANTNRYVLVFSSAWFSSDARTLNATATITNATGAANRIVGKRCLVTNANWCETAMYIANVPTGTTSDVTIGTSSSATAAGAATVVLTALDTTTPFSISTANVDAIAGTPQFTIDIPANGAAVIGCAYSTTTGNNKRFSTALITSTTLQTVFVRCVNTAGTAVWERSVDGTTWTAVGITSLNDTFVESAGGSGSVMIGASFVPR